MNTKRRGLIPLSILSIFVILAITLVLSVNIGNADIEVGRIIDVLLNKIFHKGIEVKKSTVFILWNIRLPRILLAALVGGCLSLAGVGLQAVFKNPMAEPYVTGTSAGASFGAALAIIFLKNSRFSLSLCAFISAIMATFLIYRLAYNKGRVSITNLLLAGIVLSSLLSAFVSLLMIFNQDDLVNIISYTMGSFSGANWKELGYVFGAGMAGFAILLLHYQEMNILSFGDDSASSMGVEVDKVKKIILVTTALLTAVSVSFAGIIGFVGLIVPHFFRLIIGYNHKYLLPVSFLGGGLFMLICDNIARSILPSSEIPVGIITAITGAPLFLYLLNKSKRSV